MSKRIVCVLWCAATLLSCSAGFEHASAQIRPDASYSVIRSVNFRVTYGVGLEGVAARVLETAERSRSLLIETLGPAPDGTIDILLVDNVDFSNGFASPFPSNRIVLYARPPVDDEALNYSTDWIDLVVAHELTHTFHLDRAGGVGRLLRSVFGRMPLIFPMFPAVGTPSWSTEGLAVDIESAYTGLGRLYGSEHEMIVRTAVLNGETDRMDRLNEGSPIWPGNQRVYIYGSLFMDYLTRRYGDEVQGRLLDATASAVLPPFLFFDRVAQRTIGESFDDAFAAWRSDIESRYTALADSVRAQVLTTSERLTEHGRWAIHPRVSADGRSLVYTADDGKSITNYRVIDLASGEVVESVRRNGIGVQAWMPDGSLVMSQYEFDGPYSIFSDLWLHGPEGRRLTHGARLQGPDVRADGRIIAVANADGMTRLVVVSAETGDMHALTPPDANTQWSFPRWSPDGKRIAAARWSGDGEHAIVVLDTLGTVLQTAVTGIELNLSPAWTPDGRYLIHSSDRTGITNLFAVDLMDPTGPVSWQITNVLTGAFQPEISRDGRTIYFAKYHANGYAIERMPFDPATWRTPTSARRIAGRPASSPGTAQGGAIATGPGVGGGTADQRPAATGYSPWPTLAPTFWAPVLTGADEAGTFLGFSTRAEDIIGRHAFSATASFDARGSGRWEGFFSYANARLGNPVLTFEARRRWADLGQLLLPDSTQSQRLEREDALAAFLTFRQRRWRTSATLSLGIEREIFRQRLDQQRFRLRDAEDAQTNLIASFSIANTQLAPYSVSREDGFTLAILAERSIEDEGTAATDSVGTYPENYTELRSAVGLYRSLDLGSFAHHVIALRGSGFRSTGEGAALHRLGGSTGAYAEILSFGIASGARLLPVRGFELGVLAGTRAWTASAEWRIPIALVGRRPALSPFYFDRISAAAFVDAGDAWCSEQERAISQFCRTQEAKVKPIIGAGAEAVFDIGFAGVFSGRIRTGVGVPVRGPDGRARFYIQIGSNF